MKTSPTPKAFSEELGELPENIANPDSRARRTGGHRSARGNFGLAAIGRDEWSVLSGSMDNTSNRNSWRRICELRLGDRIIVWTSPFELDVMPCCGETYEKSEVVTVESITDWVDCTYLVDVAGRGKLLVFGDGLGGPEFQLAKTVYDWVRDDDVDEDED